MTYQLFKTYLIVCCSILSYPSNVWAFQPTNGHHFVTLSSALETRKNHASIIDTNNRSPMIPSKSILYYKNLDEHEEEQQQEVPQIQQDQGKVHTNYAPSSMKTTTEQTNILTNVDPNTITTAAPRAMDLPKAFFIKTNKAHPILFSIICLLSSGICLLSRETVPSLTSDMGKKTVSVLGHSFLLPQRANSGYILSICPLMHSRS